jgi:hypothetical protein
MNQQEYKEYLNSLPPYERKAVKLYSEMKEVDDPEGCVKVISYFCKRELNQPEVSGRVFKAKETSFELVLPLSKVITLVNEKLLTKAGTVRKNMVDMKPYEIYDWAALLHYIDQAKKDNCGNVLLSKKEYGLISPTKKK